MPIGRGTRADIDEAKLLADLAARPQPSEDEIDAQAFEDGDAWTDDELAEAEAVRPPPSRAGSGASHANGIEPIAICPALRFTIDTVQQYEQGRRILPGPASTLLRVIEADPEAVERARKAG